MITTLQENVPSLIRVVTQAISRLPPLLRCLSSAEHPTVHSSLAEPLAELRDDLDKYQEMIQATVDLDAIDRGKV